MRNHFNLNSFQVLYHSKLSRKAVYNSPQFNLASKSLRTLATSKNGNTNKLPLQLRRRNHLARKKRSRTLWQSFQNPRKRPSHYFQTHRLLPQRRINLPSIQHRSQQRFDIKRRTASGSQV